MENEPTIKGIFVKSHLDAAYRLKGQAGIEAIEKRLGKPLDFGVLSDVPVVDEIKIIELALEITSSEDIPKEDMAFEAGRLHFKNFSTTPLGRLICSHPKEYLKMVLMNSRYIAEHVFRGITFQSIDEGPQKIRITMDGGRYPLDHFKGLFYEWVRTFGFDVNVDAKRLGETSYQYTLEWS